MLLEMEGSVSFSNSEALVQVTEIASLENEQALLWAGSRLHTCFSNQSLWPSSNSGPWLAVEATDQQVLVWARPSTAQPGSLQQPSL
jgi:hypothetical protein